MAFPAGNPQRTRTTLQWEPLFSCRYKTLKPFKCGLNSTEVQQHFMEFLSEFAVILGVSEEKIIIMVGVCCCCLGLFGFVWDLGFVSLFVCFPPVNYFYKPNPTEFFTFSDIGKGLFPFQGRCTTHADSHECIHYSQIVTECFGWKLPARSMS